MEHKLIIKCFIASPGDTAAERDICEKVFAEINNGIGIPYGFELQSLRWENDVYPGIGEDYIFRSISVQNSGAAVSGLRG